MVGSHLQECESIHCAMHVLSNSLLPHRCPLQAATDYGATTDQQQKSTCSMQPASLSVPML